MEKFEGARSPYEVYCFHCHVTFPAEARLCLHCGGRLYGFGERAAVGLDPALQGRALPIPAGHEAEQRPTLAVRRIGGLAIWALVAVSAILNSLCRG